MYKTSEKEYRELYEKFLELRESSVTITEIVKTLGISKSSALRWNKAAKTKRLYTEPEKIDAAKEMLESGKSYVQVAQELKVSPGRIREKLPGMGWTYSQSGKYAHNLPENHIPYRKKTEKRPHIMPVNKDSPSAFDKALMIASGDPKKPQPLCITPVDEPSPWIDWASEIEEREPHEKAAPTEQEAKLLCADCPLESICTEAALARPPYHGVRGKGLRFENGKRLRN